MPRTISGVNDLKTIRPDIALLFSKNSEIKPENVAPYSNKSALFDCNKGHSWKARISTVTAGGRCTYCANLAVLTGFNDLKTIYPGLISEYSKDNEKSPELIIATGAKRIKWKCLKCAGEWLAQARQRASGTGCPYCSGAKVLKGYNDFKTRYPNESNLWSKANLLDSSDVMPFTNKRYYFTCERHGDWKTSPNKVASGSGCPKCAINNYSSKGENELYNFLKSITKEEIIRNERMILNKYEIDIYLPKAKIGFEYNGDYWHSDKIININHSMNAKDFHSLKNSIAKEKDVKIYFIWESDWRQKKTRVEEAIVRVIKNHNDVDPILTILTKG